MSDSPETSSESQVSTSSAGFGLTLIEPLLGATTVLAIGLTVRSYGWQPILNGLQIGVGLVAFIFLWNRAFRSAPGITKTASVLGVFALLLIGTTPIWFYQAQTEARKTGVRWRLVEEDRKMQYDIYLNPPSRQEQELTPFPNAPEPDGD
jgi:hypothetical protein